VAAWPPPPRKDFAITNPLPGIDSQDRPAVALGRGPGAKVAKRALDIVGGLFGFVLVSPVLAVAAALIKLDSDGPVLFSQERIGQNFRPFRLYKLRTMVKDAPSCGGPITFDGDCRITRVGRILRRTKIDELPQLYNVLRGDMSLVGPRPESRKYVELLRQDYVEILSVQPGMTDLASIRFVDEAGLLARSADPDLEYVQHVLPEKVLLAKEYVNRSSLILDLTIILRTVARLCSRRSI
jgi:lipopolysaccharide/colanic/teichoic acid biosynthesis glycosyltransferase